MLIVLDMLVLFIDILYNTYHLALWLQDNLSAIDILAACNLVNYFGKVALGGSGVGNITLHPILLQKVSFSL